MTVFLMKKLKKETLCKNIRDYCVQKKMKVIVPPSFLDEYSFFVGAYGMSFSQVRLDVLEACLLSPLSCY